MQYYGTLRKFTFTWDSFIQQCAVLGFTGICTWKMHTLLLLGMLEWGSLFCLTYEHICSLPLVGAHHCVVLCERESRSTFLCIFMSADGPMSGENSLSSPSHRNCLLRACHYGGWEETCKISGIQYLQFSRKKLFKLISSILLLFGSVI